MQVVAVYGMALVLTMQNAQRDIGLITDAIIWDTPKHGGNERPKRDGTVATFVSQQVLVTVHKKQIQ